MMNLVIRLLKVALKLVERAARAMVETHTDDPKRDDLEMAFLEYVDEGLRAIIDGAKFPYAPSALTLIKNKKKPCPACKRAAKKKAEPVAEQPAEPATTAEQQ